MTRFLINTNVLSEFSRRGDPDPNVKQWMSSLEPVQLNVSVLTLAEIRQGIERLPPGKRRFQLEVWFEQDLLPSFPSGSILPVTLAIADRWARLSASSQAMGNPLAVVDGLLAATALENGLTVATRNSKDFIPTGVSLWNPWGFE